jgi:hypothetical protein
MDPSFSPLLELEVLDGIGDIDGLPVETCFSHGTIEKLAGWPDKWPALQILVIARLLAHKGHSRADGTFTKDGACCALHQRARRRNKGIERAKRLWFCH